MERGLWARLVFFSMEGFAPPWVFPGLHGFPGMFSIRGIDALLRDDSLTVCYVVFISLYYVRDTVSGSEETRGFPEKGVGGSLGRVHGAGAVVVVDAFIPVKMLD